jgi:hypothetical protein
MRSQVWSKWSFDSLDPLKPNGSHRARLSAPRKRPHIPSASNVHTGWARQNFLSLTLRLAFLLMPFGKCLPVPDGAIASSHTCQFSAWRCGAPTGARPAPMMSLSHTGTATYLRHGCCGRDLASTSLLHRTARQRCSCGHDRRAAFCWVSTEKRAMHCRLCRLHMAVVCQKLHEVECKCALTMGFFPRLAALLASPGFAVVSLVVMLHDKG